MIPFPGSALTMLAQRLLGSVIPDLKSAYTAADGSMIAMLVTSLAAEMEHGIARRHKDIESMRTIFRLAIDTLDAEQVPHGTKELVTRKPATLALGDVNALHDLCTRTLIELHDAVDNPQPSAVDQVVNRAIWQYLDEQAQRHKFD